MVKVIHIVNQIKHKLNPVATVQNNAVSIRTGYKHTTNVGISPHHILSLPLLLGTASLVLVGVAQVNKFNDEQNAAALGDATVLSVNDETSSLPS